jgi:hypothetical protein
MEIDGIDAMRVGTGFLLVVPGVMVSLRQSRGDSWVATGYQTGSEERWIGAGGGTFDDALGFAHVLMRRSQTQRPRPGRRYRQRAHLRVR